MSNDINRLDKLTKIIEKQFSLLERHDVIFVKRDDTIFAEKSSPTIDKILKNIFEQNKLIIKYIKQMELKNIFEEEIYDD